MIDDLAIEDLNNPKKVTGILLKTCVSIEAAESDQGFQERPGSWELWQKMENGALMRVQRWLKKSVIATYTEAKTT